MDFNESSEELANLLHYYTLTPLREEKLLSTPEADSEVAQLLAISFDKLPTAGEEAVGQLEEIIERVETIVNNILY